MKTVERCRSQCKEMGDKTEDTQPDIFIDGEKLILRVCSRRQRDRQERRGEREGVGRALGM